MIAFIDTREGGCRRVEVEWTARAIGASFRRLSDGDGIRAKSVTVHMGIKSAIVIAVYGDEPRAFRVRQP